MLLTVVGIISNSNTAIVAGAEFSCLEKQQQEEAAPDQQQDQEHFLMAFEAIVPVFSINVDVDLYAILEAPLLDVIQLKEEVPEVIPANSYFNTLFRFIISTNAP